MLQSPLLVLGIGEDNSAVATWHPGGNTLGETLKRNTRVTDVKQHSYSTTSARNLGDISSKDVNKVIGQGIWKYFFWSLPLALIGL